MIAGMHVGKKICEILGITGAVQQLDIRIAMKDVVTVVVTREIVDADKLDAVMQEIIDCQPLIVEKLENPKLSITPRPNEWRS